MQEVKYEHAAQELADLNLKKLVMIAAANSGLADTDNAEWIQLFSVHLMALMKARRAGIIKFHGRWVIPFFLSLSALVVSVIRIAGLLTR